MSSSACSETLARASDSAIALARSMSPQAKAAATRGSRQRRSHPSAIIFCAAYSVMLSIDAISTCAN